MEQLKKPFSNFGWSLKNPLSQARSHFGVETFDGKIFVLGGGGFNFEPLDSVEIYDPKTDRWTEGAPMPTRRSGIVAVSVQDRIFVMGGGFRKLDGSFEFLRTVEIYDPLRDHWEAGPQLIKQHDAPAATFYKDKIYLFGGHHPEATGGPLTDPAFSFSEVLDFTVGSWKAIPAMPTARFSLTVLPWGHCLLALGGGAFTGKNFTNFDRVEAFDPVENHWKEEVEMKLPWPGAGVGGCVLKNCLFIFGGNDGEKIQDRAACFNPSEKTWKELPPMPYSRVIMGVAGLDDEIFIIGGRGPDGKQPVDTVMTLTMG